MQLRALIVSCLLLFLSATQSLACPNNITFQQIKSTDSSEQTPLNTSHWKLHPAGTPLKGVAVVVHGLNNRPSTMNALSGVINSLNYDVLQVALSGHRGLPKEAFKVTSKAWLREITEYVCAAQEKALAEKVPLVAVGFSLGGLLLLNHLVTTTDSPSFAQVILFSPALSSKWYAQWTRWLHYLGDFRLLSQNHKDYRMESGTTAQQYQALAEIQKSFQAALKQYTGQTPVRIFLDPKDQTINTDLVKELVQKNKTQNWSLKLISSAPKHLNNFHHLFIDQRTAGFKAWELIKKQIHSWLTSDLQTGSDSL